MTIDLNGNIYIPMINSCTLLSTCTWGGNTIDVSHGGTGFTSTTVNGILCGGQHQQEHNKKRVLEYGPVFNGTRK